MKTALRETEIHTLDVIEYNNTISIFRPLVTFSMERVRSSEDASIHIKSVTTFRR